MFELVRELNRVRKEDEAQAAALGAELKRLGAIIGILQDDPERYLRGMATDDGLSDEVIESLVQQRLDARSAKDWGEADRIRDELIEKGVVLEDGAGGTSWRRA